MERVCGQREDLWELSSREDKYQFGIVKCNILGIFSKETNKKRMASQGFGSSLSLFFTQMYSRSPWGQALFQADIANNAE